MNLKKKGESSNSNLRTATHRKKGARNRSTKRRRQPSVQGKTENGKEKGRPQKKKRKKSGLPISYQTKPGVPAKKTSGRKERTQKHEQSDGTPGTGRNQAAVVWKKKQKKRSTRRRRKRAGTLGRWVPPWDTDDVVKGGL